MLGARQAAGAGPAASPLPTQSSWTSPFHDVSGVVDIRPATTKLGVSPSAAWRVSSPVRRRQRARRKPAAAKRPNTSAAKHHARTQHAPLAAGGSSTLSQHRAQRKRRARTPVKLGAHRLSLSRHNSVQMRVSARPGTSGSLAGLTSSDSRPHTPNVLVVHDSMASLHRGSSGFGQVSSWEVPELLTDSSSDEDGMPLAVLHYDPVGGSSGRGLVATPIDRHGSHRGSLSQLRLSRAVHHPVRSARRPHTSHQVRSAASLRRPRTGDAQARPRHPTTPGDSRHEHGSPKVPRLRLSLAGLVPTAEPPRSLGGAHSDPVFGSGEAAPNASLGGDGTAGATVAAPASQTMPPRFDASGASDADDTAPPPPAQPAAPSPTMSPTLTGAVSNSRFELLRIDTGLTLESERDGGSVFHRPADVITPTPKRAQRLTRRSMPGRLPSQRPRHTDGRRPTLSLQHLLDDESSYRRLVAVAPPAGASDGDSVFTDGSFGWGRTPKAPGSAPRSSRFSMSSVGMSLSAGGATLFDKPTSRARTERHNSRYRHPIFGTGLGPLGSDRASAGRPRLSVDERSEVGGSSLGDVSPANVTAQVEQAVTPTTEDVGGPNAGQQHPPGTFSKHEMLQKQRSNFREALQRAKVTEESTKAAWGVFETLLRPSRLRLMLDLSTVNVKRNDEYVV